MLFELAVWTTLFWLTSAAGIFGWSLALKSGSILIFAGLAYLLREHRFLALCTLGFTPSVALGAPILAAPCFLCLAVALRRPPFDIFTNVFRYPATTALVIAALASVYAQFTREEDLLLAPFVVIYLIFAVTWAMWSRTVSRPLKFFVLLLALGHMAQASSWAVGAPNWFVWFFPFWVYFLTAAGLWFLIAYLHHGEKSAFRLPV